MEKDFYNYLNGLESKRTIKIINDKLKEKLSPKQMLRLYDLVKWAYTWQELPEEVTENDFNFMLQICEDFKNYVNKNYIDYKTAIKIMNKIQETKNLKNKDLKELKKIYMAVLECEPSDYLNLNYDYEPSKITDIMAEFSCHITTIIRKI